MALSALEIDPCRRPLRAGAGDAADLTEFLLRQRCRAERLCSREALASAQPALETAPVLHDRRLRAIKISSAPVRCRNNTLCGLVGLPVSVRQDRDARRALFGSRPPLPADRSPTALPRPGTGTEPAETAGVVPTNVRATSADTRGL